MIHTNHELTFNQLDQVSGGQNKSDAMANTKARIAAERDVAWMNYTGVVVAAGVTFGGGAAAAAGAA